MEDERANGVVIGIVTDLKDEDGIARIKVKYPHLENQESNWARLAMPMAGKNRGTFFRPEKDDEVLVAFEHGDPRRPYILGSLWSRTDQPPNAGPAEQNNKRLICSRSGHLVVFDDTKDSEKIELIDKDNTLHVVLDSVNKTVKVTSDNGNVEVSAATGSVLVEAKTVKISAKQDMTLEAGGTMTISGSTVNIN